MKIRLWLLPATILLAFALGSLVLAQGSNHEKSGNLVAECKGGTCYHPVDLPDGPPARLIYCHDDPAGACVCPDKTFDVRVEHQMDFDLVRGGPIDVGKMPVLHLGEGGCSHCNWIDPPLEWEWRLTLVDDKGETKTYEMNGETFECAFPLYGTCRMIQKKFPLGSTTATYYCAQPAEEADALVYNQFGEAYDALAAIAADDGGTVVLTANISSIQQDTSECGACVYNSTGSASTAEVTLTGDGWFH